MQAIKKCNIVENTSTDLATHSVTRESIIIIKSVYKILASYKCRLIY